MPVVAVDVEELHFFLNLTGDPEELFQGEAEEGSAETTPLEPEPPGETLGTVDTAPPPSKVKYLTAGEVQKLSKEECKVKASRPRKPGVGTKHPKHLPKPKSLRQPKAPQEPGARAKLLKLAMENKEEALQQAWADRDKAELEATKQALRAEKERSARLHAERKALELQIYSAPKPRPPQPRVEVVGESAAESAVVRGPKVNKRPREYEPAEQVDKHKANAKFFFALRKAKKAKGAC